VLKQGAERQPREQATEMPGIVDAAASQTRKQAEKDKSQKDDFVRYRKLS
jgi:hypothetical protein